MADLDKVSGLPISFENGNLLLKDDVVSLQVQPRKIDEVRDFLEDKDVITDLRDIYLMYRDVHFKSDESLFRSNQLRYDITIIFPGLLGREFIKTIGHYHSIKPGTEISYPEIYEVLDGTALFLFQEAVKENEIGNIYLVKAEVGQKVIIPPGFGHITINPDKKPLIIADIFVDNITSVYDFFKNHHGGAYYIIKSKISEDIEIKKNQNYKRISDLKIAEPKEIPELNIVFHKPLYSLFKDNPKNFEFLVNPEKFENILRPDKLFRINK